MVTTSSSIVQLQEQYELEDDKDRYLFRRVRPDAAREGRGRFMPTILYERSICGTFPVRGRRLRVLYNNSKDQPEVEQNNNNNNNNHDGVKSPQTVVVLERRVPPKPTKLLNNDKNSGSILSNDNNDSDDHNHRNHELNAGLAVNSRDALIREIRLFAEFCSVTRFHWSYLYLVNREERQEMLMNSNSSNNNNRHVRRLNNDAPGTSSTSTISIAFSPNGRTFASTHGDHNVKITCCHTGRLIRNLEGHPRTPWTVKYHPIRNNIVASGCLGFQVRIWDWNATNNSNINSNNRNKRNTTYNNDNDEFSYEDGFGVCLNMIRLQYAIISLSFHPSGLILAVASGQTMHLWDYSDYAGRNQERQRKLQQEQEQIATAATTTSNDDTGDNTTTTTNTSNSSSTTIPVSNINSNTASSLQQGIASITAGNSLRYPSFHHQNEQVNIRIRNDMNGARVPPTRGRGPVTEIRYEHSLRCVHFPPCGKTIIIGGVNPTDSTILNGNNRNINGGSMSFSLRLWDFDLVAALYPHLYLNRDETMDSTATETSNTTNTTTTNNTTTNNTTNTTNNYNNNNNSGSNVSTPSSRIGIRLRREAISNPRPIVPRALLYNDGGFDVSPDGETLCACAEYWLPDGVQSVMDLFDDDEEDVEDTEESLANNSDRNGDESSDNTEASSFRGESAFGSSNRNQSNTTNCSTSAMSRSSGGDSATENNDNNNNETRTASRNINNNADGENRSRNLSGNTSNSIVSPSPPRDAAAAAVPRTPPNPPRPQTPLTPPSPPGRRFQGGLARRRVARSSTYTSGNNNPSADLSRIGNQTGSHSNYMNYADSMNSRADSSRSFHQPMHQPHPLSLVGRLSRYPHSPPKGKYVPHIVTVRLNTSIANSSPYNHNSKGRKPFLGQLLEASPLNSATASGVTCVKFSPSTEYCLLGYGVRENNPTGPNAGYHPVTAVYRIRGGMQHVSTMLSSDDDVNIARFHPESGHGFVYGTKQGRVRNMSPRPWNYYN